MTFLYRSLKLVRSIKWLSIIFILFQMETVQAGVAVAGTRVIYDGSKRQASISVNNSEDDVPNLIQAFVNTGVSGEKAPFIVTPPLFRLEPGKEHILRIIRTGGSIPEDRESVFYLNIKSIPSVQEYDKNMLLITVKTRIKLFYRPVGIQDRAEDAHSTLKFRRMGNQIQVYNPSNYYVTFSTLKIGEIEIAEADMVAPRDTVRYSLPAGSAGNVSWESINSYGGISERMTQVL